MVSLPDDGESLLESGGARIFSAPEPVYILRYNAVVGYVNSTEAKRVLDIGCAECSLLRALTHCPSVEELCGVDLDGPLVLRSQRAVEPLPFQHLHRRFSPLTVRGLCGSIAEPCREFVDYDLITMVEIIEHLYDETLAQVPPAVFGSLRPRAAIVTTPNADFNVLFPDMGAENGRKFRHWDHKFEWSRKEFETWSNGVALTYGYSVKFSGIGPGLEGTQHLGCCSQMALFERIDLAEASDHTEGPCAAGARLKPAEGFPKRDFVDYDEMWSVPWPHCPRSTQIFDQVCVAANQLARRAAEFREDLDYDEEIVPDSITRQVQPVLREGSDGPCSCGYEKADDDEADPDSCTFGTIWAAHATDVVPKVNRCLPHICMERVVAWTIPFGCVLDDYSLAKMNCTEVDIFEALDNPPERDPSVQILGAAMSVALSEDRSQLVCSWTPEDCRNRRYFDDDSDEHCGDGDDRSSPTWPAAAEEDSWSNDPAESDDGLHAPPADAGCLDHGATVPSMS